MLSFRVNFETSTYEWMPDCCSLDLGWFCRFKPELATEHQRVAARLNRKLQEQQPSTVEPSIYRPSARALKYTARWSF